MDDDLYQKPHVAISEINAFALHMHKQIEVACVLEGKTEVQVDFKRYSLAPYDIMFASCYAIHSYTPAPTGAKMCKIIINPSTLGTLGEMLLEYRPKNPIIPSEKILGIFPNIATDLETLARNLHYNSPLEQYADSCCDLIIFLSRLLEITEIQKYKSGNNDIYMKIIEACCNHYTESNYGVSELSKALKISTTRIQRLFSENMNMSMQNYIMLLRMDNAKSLLKETDIPITRIALDLGFSSISAFNHAFHRANKLSPSSYRKQAKNEVIK